MHFSSGARHIHVPCPPHAVHIAREYLSNMACADAPNAQTSCSRAFPSPRLPFVLPWKEHAWNSTSSSLIRSPAPSRAVAAPERHAAEGQHACVSDSLACRARKGAAQRPTVGLRTAALCLRTRIIKPTWRIAASHPQPLGPLTVNSKPQRTDAKGAGRLESKGCRPGQLHLKRFSEDVIA